MALKRILSVLSAVCLSMAAVFYTCRVMAEESMPDNGIPVVYINIDESQGTIDDMMNSPDHSDYCYGTISIDVPEGFHYSDFPDLACLSVTDLSMSIRGRGNSTWTRAEKKPFKIKLDSKADLFGLGENKHWVLVANALDESLLRDRITAWLGDQMGFEFTPRGVPVDLVMSGENFGTKYLGSYYLSENVRVDKNRLAIDELKESDTEEPIITGGYLLQDALQVRPGSPDRFFTSRGVDWATHTPSFDTEADALLGEALEEGLEGALLEESFAGAELADAYENPVQQAYIQDHIQKFEDVLFAGGSDYRELMDVKSAAAYWLINEASLNSDAYITGSTYIYKKRDTDGTVGRLYWGPLWDFDYAWDNRDITEGFTVPHEWLKPMFCDRGEGGFTEEIKAQWPILRSCLMELIAEGGVIDQYYEETKHSAEQDRIINHAGEEYDYRDKVEKLKNWIAARVAWMDENMYLVDDLVHQLTFVGDEGVFDLQFIENGRSPEELEDHPEKEGYTFLGWADEDGNYIDTRTQIVRDMTVRAQYVSDSEATHGKDIAFRKDSDVISYNIHASSYQIDYCVLPRDAADQKVEWSSSDESYASVDENGIITFRGPGQVTVTASLKYGKTREFTLTVMEGEVPVPRQIIPERETIRMRPGDTDLITVSTEPAAARIFEYVYEPEDESVVRADEYGILTAVGEGETSVRVYAYGGDYWGGNPDILETAVNVIVAEAEPEPEPEPEIIYTVTSGSTNDWKKGSGRDAVIVISRSAEDESCLAHFVSLKMDGSLLQRDTDYTAAAGSTVITLKADMLEKLKEGKHTVTAVFDDGEAEASLTVLKESVPDTSDERNERWLLLLAGSAVMFSLAMAIRKRTFE